MPDRVTERRPAAWRRRTGAASLLLGLLVAVAALAPAAPTAPAQAAPPHYKACIGLDGKCRTAFTLGDSPEALFTDNRHAQVKYKVCPELGFCLFGKTGKTGGRDDVGFFFERSGRGTAKWYVDGRLVAEWSFRIAD